MNNAIIDCRVELQTAEISSITSNSIHSLRRFVRGKQNCQIINPGYIANELIKESHFRKAYSFELWEKFTSANSLNEVLKEEDAIILLDHTGKNELSASEFELINNLKLGGRKVYSIVSFYETVTGRIPLIYIAKGWAVNNDLFYVNTRWKFLLLKRVLDIAISLILLPIALILSMIGMILIKVSSKGPALFSQKRIGKNGKPFILYKIRSMIYTKSGYNNHTIKNDERVTLMGRFLRITKIDELPQLLNILKGDMSLIGPRPEKVDIVEKLIHENPYYNLRHTIKPGITGWAQVNNPTATPDQNLEKLEYDLYYLKNMSIFLDLRVLWRTTKVVLTLDSL